MGPLFRAVDCTFANNAANDEAGGIRCMGASAELVRCTISGNSAGGFGAGGGFVLRPSSLGTATFTQCTLANNTATAVGSIGGMVAHGGTMNLIHCTVFGNTGKHVAGRAFCQWG